MIAILILFGAVFGFVASTMVVSHLLGPKRHTQHKDEAFECGIPSDGDARSPFAVRYFLVAILFVLFDVEIVFFYPWAVNFRWLAWQGFGMIMLFVLSIAIAFLYIYRQGVLDFEKD